MAANNSGGLGVPGAVKLTYEPDVPGPALITFSTPGEYDWIVPDGITQGTITVINGGDEGDDGHSGDSQQYGGTGGSSGDWATGTMTLIPGQSYHVIVGGPDNGAASSFENFAVIFTPGNPGQTAAQTPGSAGGNGANSAAPGGGSGGTGGVGADLDSGNPGSDGSQGGLGAGGGGGGGALIPGAQGGKGGNGLVKVVIEAGPQDEIEEIFNTPGKYFWTVPDSVTFVNVIAIGGGQNGEPGNADDAGQGGASGSTVVSNWPLTPGDVHLIVVGDRVVYNGEFGAAGDSGMGGDETFTARIAYAQGGFNQPSVGPTKPYPNFGKNFISLGVKGAKHDLGRSQGGYGANSAEGIGGVGGSNLGGLGIGEPGVGYGAGGGGGAKILTPIPRAVLLGEVPAPNGNGAIGTNGYLDLNPATATIEFLGEVMQPSNQRTIFTEFTDITCDPAFPYATPTYTVLSSATFANNLIGIDSVSNFVQIINNGTTSNQDITVQINDSANAILKIKAGKTQILKNMNIFKLAFQGGLADTALDLVISISPPCS